MLNIENKKDCVGCGLCVNVCPRNCISLEVDSEGFWYPKIDLDKCIDCDLCEKKCPKINEFNKLEREEYPKVLAAWNKDSSIRSNSSSGGVFSAMATKIFEENGYVCGAIYDENNLVKHIVTNNFDDLKKLQTSKYAQSDFSNVFKDIKEKLKNNKVLVCATPCQIASLYMYLGRDYDNLITCDFICHGVNSPKVFKMYTEYLEKKYKSKIKNINLRDKTYGWHDFGTKITFENGKEYIANIYYDSYMIGFLQYDAFLRESCFSCSFRSLPRQSDFTLADFWGIENINKELDNDRGTSMLLINSKKAYDFLEKIKADLFYKEILDDRVFDNNPSMYKSVPISDVRKEVMSNLDNYSYKELSNKFFKEPPFYKRTHRKIRVGLSKIKRKVYKLIGK